MRSFFSLRGLLLAAACSLMCVNAGAADDPTSFHWTGDTAKPLLGAEVYWDFMEGGAPLLVFQGGGSEKELLKAVQIAFRYGELPSGDYAYQKPEHAQLEHNDAVNALPTSSTFHFEEKHLKLIRHMVVRHSYSADGGEIWVGVDPKRPYGDFSYFEAEMAEILGKPTSRNEKNQVVLSPEVEQEMSRLHQDMSPAVQVFLRHARVKAGVYKEGGYGAWERL